MKKKLRVAIIGCGRILPMHAVPATVLEQSELVAVCDIRAERAKAAAEKYGCKAYTDYKDLLKKEKLDAVHVCIPHYLHPIVSEYALSCGVNVLSEKPMAIDYKSAEKCVRTAERFGLNYGVILQCRYNKSAQLVKRALLGGRLGKIISARSTLTWTRPDSYYAESDWKGTWDKEGGGVVIDQAIHSMDLVNWFIGDTPVKVDVSIANRGHEIVKVEDSAEGLITYRNGVRYGFYCMNNYGCDEPIEIRLLCEKGKAVLTYDDACISYDDGTNETVVEQGSDIVYEGGKDYWGFQHIKQISQFYNAVLGLEPLEISGREALKIQKLICAVYESGKSGRPVYLNEEKK